jgi:FKBP-type peptidyl-prolyl cis-trans isomerase FklB
VRWQHLIDGSVFDSSTIVASPPVSGGVIAGWTETLQLMNAGSKCLYGHPASWPTASKALAASRRSVLVFDVERGRSLNLPGRIMRCLSASG